MIPKMLECAGIPGRLAHVSCVRNGASRGNMSGARRIEMPGDDCRVARLTDVFRVGAGERGRALANT